MSECNQISVEELNDRLRTVEHTCGEILDRNAQVEADKDWELSKTRRSLLLGLTYAITAFVFLLIGVPFPFRNALIPTVGYLLSTLTLPLAKSAWTKRYRPDLNQKL